jgi:hypothetical protein
MNEWAHNESDFMRLENCTIKINYGSKSTRIDIELETGSCTLQVRDLPTLKKAIKEAEAKLKER